MTAADLFDQARQGLLTHRLRATMSSIGIVVGVGTVVASLAVGEGARRSAIADIGALGIDNVFARAVPTTGGPHASPRAPELTRADGAAIQAAIGGVETVALVRTTRAEVSAGTRTVTAPVAGVSTGWADFANVRCARGRWLSEEDERTARRVAVLGTALARRLAPGQDPVGLLISANGEVFRVVGVLESIERRSGAAALQAFSPDDAALMPAGVMDARLGEGDSVDRVSEIGVHVARGQDVGAVSAAMATLLRRRHPEAKDSYELIVPRELLQTRLRAQRTFDAVLLATGFIALMISGVGIMNIMMASVAEREQEIGVRRAFGARRREIVQQFAIEAALLCLAGGLAGVPLGAALAWTVSQLAGWPVAVSMDAVLLAVTLAASVGLGFGIYPAYRAASINPIEALRA